MNLYILGKNSDDKGNQLEKLTCKLLENLGFINIVKNEISNGGHEIDVRADYIVPGLEGNSCKPILCECKAYKNTVPMSDWLKFLGKILVEEHKGNLDAYFIALNGVNGNVSGNYRDLQNLKRNNVKLITGENLIKLLQKTYDLRSINEIQLIIENLTTRKPIEICYAYYNFQVFYLIGFSENVFSLISNNGTKIQNVDETNLFADLIVSNTSYSSFIDLEVENKNIERQSLIKRYLVAHLLNIKKGSTSKNFQKLLIEYDKSISDVKVSEITNALEDLITDNIITKVKSTYNLIIILEKPIVEYVANMYKFLFNGAIPFFVFGCEYYDKFIDRNLLQYICETQEGLNIPEENINEVLKILQLSPSALIKALYPDPMIVNHRGKGLTNELIDQEDVNYFIQNSGMLLANDFKNPNLSEYFFKVRNLIELETNNNIIIKSRKCPEYELDFKERLQLGEMAEEYNKRIMIVKLLNNQPEPWDVTREGIITA